MLFTEFLLIVVVTFFVLYITRVNNIWGVSKATKKAREDVRIEKQKVSRRNRTVRILSVFGWIERNIGRPLNEIKRIELLFKLERLNKVLPSIGRTLTPAELNGIFKFLRLIGVVGLIIGLTQSTSILNLAFVPLIVVGSFFHMYADSKISYEDAQLERDFPNFYMIIYSRLLMGAEMRLAPTLTDFLNSLDTTSFQGDSAEVLRKFVLDFRRNIEIYGDDSIAIKKLRDKYRSVTVVNFCNLAAQAINGVDNHDKLLAFKIELSARRMEYMKEKADKMVARGERATMFIYLILAQFVVLSWYAKFTQTGGGLGGMFGF